MELCLACYNKINQTSLKESQVILSAPSDLDRCSHCGKTGRVIVRVPSKTPWGWAQCRYWKIMDKLEG